MTDKAIIFDRSAKSMDNEWYDKGKRFLKENECADLTLSKSTADEKDDKALFEEAIAAVHKISNGNVTIDKDAAVFVVTAHSSRGIHADECMCKCGGNASSCGGGGGGGSRAQ